ALGLNRRVFSKTRDQRKDREREERRRDINRTTPVNESQRRTGTPSKVIRLEYAGGSVDVNVRQGDENKLLRALKTAGGRSI
ncbi:hypothetical protein, partial [Sansalvadorimonas verongulae]|uniref:hypothetical protein n=1 Tax=Sansalvadorimonas verongulae TaxID=2172824 RepID=UPI0018AD2B3B